MYVLLDAVGRVLACSESKGVLVDSCNLTWNKYHLNTTGESSSGFTLWGTIEDRPTRVLAVCVECDELTNPCKLGE